jgi:hypothetical protein
MTNLLKELINNKFNDMINLLKELENNKVNNINSVNSNVNLSSL